MDYAETAPGTDNQESRNLTFYLCYDLEISHCGEFMINNKTKIIEIIILHQSKPTTAHLFIKFKN